MWGRLLFRYSLSVSLMLAAWRLKRTSTRACLNVCCRYVFNESARYRSPTLLLGIPFLLITFIIMLVVTLAILTFRMIGTFGSDFKDDTYFNPTTAPIVGGMLNALWITVMNAFYTARSPWSLSPPYSRSPPLPLQRAGDERLLPQGRHLPQQPAEPPHRHAGAHAAAPQHGTHPQLHTPVELTRAPI